LNLNHGERKKNPWEQLIDDANTKHPEGH